MYRVMIADDEEIECIALERMLSELANPVQTLPSVYDGDDLLVRAAKEKPDIVIADVNMPGLTGLEAVELLHLKRPEMKIIIHSAYFNYEYMQKALQLGAVDYILKPAVRQDVENAVSKAIMLLDQEKRENEKRIQKDAAFYKMRQVAGNAIFLSALSGEPDENSFRVFCDNLPRASESGYICAVRLDQPRGEIRTAAFEEIDLFLEEYYVHFGTLHQDVIWLYLFSEDETQRGLQKIIKTMETLKEKMEQNGSAVSIGISQPVREFARFLLSMDQAETMMNRGKRSGEICAYRRNEKSDPKKQTETLWELDVEAMRVWTMDLYLRRLEYLSYEEKIISGYPLAARVWDSLRALRTKAEIQEWYAEHVKKKETREPKVYSEYIRKSISFIDQHYREDISLNETAEYAGVSSFYLTRLLRQELDETFIDILTDRRMIAAQGLLRQGELTIKEVGEAVGYPNPIYFNRVFKKNAGITAGAVREILSGNIRGL